MTFLSQDRNSTGPPRNASWIGRSSLAAIGMAAAVMALWQPATLPLDSPGHILHLQVPGWVLLALAGALVAVFLAIVSSLIPTPRRKDPEDFELEPPPPPKLSPSVLVLMFLLLAVAILGAFMVLHLLDLHHVGGAMAPVSGIRAPLPAARPELQRTAVHAGAIDWGLTLTLGAAAAVIIGGAVLIIAGNEPWWVIAQWFRMRKRRKLVLVRDLTSAVSEGMRDLAVGDDPRRAVIACYRRCEAALTSRRRRRYPAETPREFVADALVALHLPLAAIQSLLQVFERARFSELPITSKDRDVALASLGDIRSALDRSAQDGSAD
jgi:hypothetical protein